MKTYSVKIMNLADLFKFNHYVRKNHIRGSLVQGKYKVSAGNVFGIMVALPLDSAELNVESCSETASGIIYTGLQQA